MPRTRRDRAPLAAVLCTGAWCCACARRLRGPGDRRRADARADPAEHRRAAATARPARARSSSRRRRSSASVLVRPRDAAGRARGGAPSCSAWTRARGWRNVARTRVPQHRALRHALASGPQRAHQPARRRRAPRERGRRRARSRTSTSTGPRSATYFGPGLYGNKTFCGQILTPQLHGVAHRRLPCGTQVAILFDRREIIVPVVDRGPFNGGYDWDLTQATADALGFTASGGIGYVRLRPA